MSNSSYFEKIGNSFIGVLIGIILFVISLVVLWWNEGNFVRNLEHAQFIETNVVEADSRYIAGVNEGKLIHTSGLVTSSELLNDELIKVPDAVSLIRNIEMYQWKEIRENNSDNNSNSAVTYKYTTGWDKNIIDFQTFQNPDGHENPDEFSIQPLRINASNVTLGDYVLTKKQVSMITPTRKITQLPYNDKYKILNGFYFTGLDYDNPAIGDLKISYAYVPSETTVSVIAKQTRNYLTAYKFKQGEISMLSMGNQSAQEMVNQLKSSNFTLTIILRIAGFIALLIALNLIIAPISSIFSFSPLLASFITSLTGVAIFLISIAISLFVISISWIAYRPTIGIPIFLTGITLFLLLPRKRHFRIK